MKTLYIIRHAKSSWEDPSLDDFDRPLMEKWEKRAKKRWIELREEWIMPDKVFSSPANRAKATTEIICKKIGYDVDKIKYEQWIYDNHLIGIDYYISFIKDLKDKYDTVFMVWHNMAFEELANYLSKWSSWPLKTAWVVKIDFDVDSWKDIEA